MSEEKSETKTRSKLLKRLIKLTLTALVLAFVTQRAMTLLSGKDFSDFSICPGWLAVSGVFYAIGWLPSIWFWRGLLSSLNEKPGWILAGKAYFAGHLGKYIPGKAGVLLLRSGVLTERGHAFGAGVITSAYETLVVMGVGLLVAGLLGPLLVPEEILLSWSEYFGSASPNRWLPGAILIAIALLSAPLIANLLTRLASKLTPKETPKVPIKTIELLRGYLAFFGCWGMLGLSLGAALQSVSPQWLSLADWPLWTAAVSASTVIGFFAIFTPGGLGVREGIMMEILRFQPGITQQQAVAASLLLRLVWLATEATMFGICWFLERRQHRLRVFISVVEQNTENPD